MSFFEQISPWAMHHRATLMFGLIWVTITITAAICTSTTVGRVAAPPSEERARRPSNLILRWPQLWRRRPVPAVLILLGVFLICYIAITLVWEDFANDDDSYFTLFTLRGQNIHPPIWPESGRFFPLGLQEFNVVRHFTDNIVGYHLFVIVQLISFASLLLLIDDDLSITARAALLTLALLTPSILFSFSVLWVNERFVMLFLLCIVLSVKRFEETQSTFWALAAVASAQIMIYNKETAFLLLLGFAVSRLILRCRNTDDAAWRFHLFWAREGRLDLCLAFLSVVYLIMYLGFMGIHGKMEYATSSRLPRHDIVLGYLRMDLLPWLLLVFLLGRIYLILSRQAPPLLLWDGLAVGGVAYFFAYLYLSMFGVYYLAPVDLIAIFYAGRFAIRSWVAMRSWAKMAAMLLTIAILSQNAFVSAFALFERKNIIHAKAQIASIIKTEYRKASDLRLFFPFAGGYYIMEFGSYLNYRGIPVEEAPNERPVSKSIVLAEAIRTRAKLGEKLEDGPCVRWYTAVWCRLVSEPAPGDLVIVLPDDKASLAEASEYRKQGKVIFSYRPWPSIPRWLCSLFSSLHIGPTRYRYDPLPDRWMDASVTKWQ